MIKFYLVQILKDKLQQEDSKLKKWFAEFSEDRKWRSEIVLLVVRTTTKDFRVVLSASYEGLE